jgi:hypothetical protein
MYLKLRSYRGQLALLQHTYRRQKIAYPLETGAIKHEKTRGQALSAPVVIINDTINDTINDIIQNVIGDNVGWCRHSLMRRIVHGTCCSLFCR